MPRKKKQEVPILYVVDERSDPTEPLDTHDTFTGGLYTKDALIEALEADVAHDVDLPVIYKLVPVKYTTRKEVTVTVEIED